MTGAAWHKCQHPRPLPEDSEAGKDMGGTACTSHLGRAGSRSPCPVGDPQARAANQEDVVCCGFGVGMRVGSHGLGGEARHPPPTAAKPLQGGSQTGDEAGSGCESPF